MRDKTRSKNASRIPADHVTDAPSLKQRIEDMEQRLMVERAQAVAHAREFRGNVRRRIATPTNLVFASSLGFIAAEVISARSAAARASARSGGSKAQQKSARKSVLAPLVKSLAPLLHLGSLGFLAKASKDTSKSLRTSASAASATAPATTVH